MRSLSNSNDVQQAQLKGERNFQAIAIVDVFAGEPINELSIVLSGVVTEKERKGPAPTVQLSYQLIPGSSEETWIDVIPRCAEPEWEKSVLIPIPAEEPSPGAHIRFLLWDCNQIGRKLTAFAFLPLCCRHTILINGSYALRLFKVEEGSTKFKQDPKRYLAWPWLISRAQNGKKTAVNRREQAKTGPFPVLPGALFLSVHFRSSIHPQNEFLAAFLTSPGANTVSEVLSCQDPVPMIPVADRILREIILLLSQDSGQAVTQVFTHVLERLWSQDEGRRRIEAYLARVSTLPRIFPPILEHIGTMSDNLTSSEALQTCAALQPLFRFAVASSQSPEPSSEFKPAILSAFTALCRVFTEPSHCMTTLTIQTELLIHIPVVLKNLTSIMEAEEILDLLEQILLAIESKTSHIPRPKLVHFMCNISKLDSASPPSLLRRLLSKFIPNCEAVKALSKLLNSAEASGHVIETKNLESILLPLMCYLESTEVPSIHCLVLLCQVLSIGRQSMIPDELPRLLQIIHRTLDISAFPPRWSSLELAFFDSISNSVQDLRSAVTESVDTGCLALYFRLSSVLLLRYRNNWGQPAMGLTDALSQVWAQRKAKTPSMELDTIQQLMKAAVLPQPEVRVVLWGILADLLAEDKDSQLPVILAAMDAEILKVLDPSLPSQLKDWMTTALRRRKEERRDDLMDIVGLLSELAQLLMAFGGAENGSFVHNYSEHLLMLFYQDQVPDKNLQRRHLASLANQLVHSCCWSEAGAAYEALAQSSPDASSTESALEAALQYYQTAGDTEAAIRVAKALSRIYEARLGDYPQLSRVLRTLAALYEMRGRPASLPPSYFFRLHFKGPQAPTLLRDKTIILRGKPGENLQELRERLEKEWPHAAFLSPESKAPLTARMSVILCSVQPTGLSTHFTSLRPAGPSRERGEPESLWSQRRESQTEHSLPGLVPWSLVISERSELLSPIQNATLAVREKTAELRRSLKDCEEGGGPVQPLLMLLKGAVEPTVNGGIGRYCRAFLGQETTPEARELRNLLGEQMRTLEEGLCLAAEIVSPDCRPLLAHLEASQRALACLLDTGASKLCPPTPISLPSPSTSSNHRRSAPTDSGLWTDESDSETPSSLQLPLPSLRKSLVSGIRRRAGRRPASVHCEGLAKQNQGGPGLNGSDSDLLRSHQCHSSPKRDRVKSLLLRIGEVTSSPRAVSTSPSVVRRRLRLPGSPFPRPTAQYKQLGDEEEALQQSMSLQIPIGRPSPSLARLLSPTRRTSQTEP